MRILIVAERYWPEVGAAPSRLANLAEGLKGKGYEVDVLTSLPNYPTGKIFDGYRSCISKQENHEGINLFRYWIYATVSRSPIPRVLNMFSFALMIWMFVFHAKRIRGYDRIIIQTPTLVVAASAMVIFKLIYRKCCVLNVSDIWPTTAIDMGVIKEGSKSYRFMAMLERFLYRNANAILGQSQEILDHISNYPNSGKLFLYRNLQRYRFNHDHKTKSSPLKLVFSGMLGVAQDVAGIVKNVPFGEMDVEFHIFGGGKQLDEIQNYIKEKPNCQVFAHGFVPKEEIADRLREYHVSIIPLATRIRGAVPSKLYDTVPQGLPILFCGGGEGATFILDRNIGLVSEPSDFRGLQKNIQTFVDMPLHEYESMSDRCIHVSQHELDFDKQMNDCFNFLNKLA